MGTPEDVPMDLPTPTRQKVAPVLKPYKEQFSDWRSAPEQKTEEQKRAEAQIARQHSEMMAKYGSKRTPSPAAPPPQPPPARQKPESVPIAAQPVQAMAPARRLGGGPRKTRLTSSVPREAAAPKVIGYQGGKGVTQMPHKGMGRRTRDLSEGTLQRRYGMQTRDPMDIQTRKAKRKRDEGVQVAEQREKARLKALPSKATQLAATLDKTLGSHGALPSAPVAKRPRPQKPTPRPPAPAVPARPTQTAEEAGW